MMPLPTRMAVLICHVSLLPACSGGAANGDDPGSSDPFPEPAVEWEPEHYVAYRSDIPVTIDGRIEEPSWQDAPWTNDFVDIEGDVRPTPRFRTRAKMLWDDTYFYVAAEMEDPHVWATLTRRDTVIYYDNDFEVFIDPDGDTHEYYELEINALGTEWDLLLMKPYRDGGPAISAWDIQGLKTGVAVDGTINRPWDRDRGWSVEIAIPWAVLKEAAHMPTPPEPGDQWRVNFSRVQWRAEVEDGVYLKIVDSPPGRSRPEDNWVWSPQGIISMHYPEMWGFVQFSGRLAGQRGDTFSLRPDDEAKWVLRQVYYRQKTWFGRHGRYTDDAAALGLEDLRFPVEISVTPSFFEASLTSADGRRIRISQDGRVW